MAHHAVPNATPYASASLYVGDINNDVTEALLFEIFNAVGPVASVRVCRDATTRRSLGYAYVNFHRVDDAERALDTMNFKEIRGKACRIMWSHRDPSLRRSGLGNIFVKNLAKSIDNKLLHDTFSIIGNILSCKVATNANGESLGYGFVHFESEESAAKAIAKVNGKLIANQRVTVSAFKSKKERNGSNKFVFTNIFVKNLPKDFDEVKLKNAFDKFGTITSSYVAKDNKTQESRGFGFINYEKPEEAAAAVKEMNDFAVDEEHKLYVGRAQKKDEREKELREKFEAMKVERQKKYAGVNLYVKNLSDDIDDEKLREAFEKFGSITSAKVMIDSATKKSRGFGFVCFSTPEEATKAVTDMNGKMMDSKPLYVALAQRKDIRRQQLEQQHSQRAKLGIPQPAMYPPQAGPMYFPGMPRQPMMYPQQMVPRRWNPNPNPPPVNMMTMQGPRINYQLMPLNARTGPPNRRRNQRQPKDVINMANGQQQGQNFKFTDNVRNRNMPQQQAVAQQQPADQVSSSTADQPLTIKALAAATEEQKKQMIGERLFPLIKAQQPELAGKITGMLLEMDNGELIHLLESPAALTEKINEALAVLKQYPMEEILAEQEAAESQAGKA